METKSISDIRYHLDDSLFNLQLSLAYTKTLGQLNRYFSFADDAAQVAHIERALPRIPSDFTEVAQLFWLEVFLKTLVLHQLALQEEYRPSHIAIGATELKTVHRFICLERTITSYTKIDKEVDKGLQRRAVLLTKYTNACDITNT